MRALILTLACWTVFAQTPNLVEQADAAFRAGNRVEAERLARLAVSRYPQAAHAHLILGIVAAQEERWPQAKLHFTTVIRLTPNDPNGHFYLGQAELYQKNWLAASRQFTKALDLGFPDRERALVELAFSLNEAGKPKEALQRLNEVPAPPDGSLGAQYFATKAFALAKLNDFGPAIDSMRKACLTDPGNPQYSEFLISTLISVDQTTVALQEAIRAQAQFPDHPEIQFLFALADYYVSESPLGPVALRNLTEAKSGSAHVFLAEGLLLRKKSENDEALRLFEKAAASGLPESHLLLGILYKEKGDYELAATQFEKAHKVGGLNGQLLLELGKLSLANGDLKGSLANLMKAAELMPTSISVHYQLGLLYQRLGEIEKAREHIQLSRELDRKQAELQGRPRQQP